MAAFCECAHTPHASERSSEKLIIWCRQRFELACHENRTCLRLELGTFQRLLELNSLQRPLRTERRQLEVKQQLALRYNLPLIRLRIEFHQVQLRCVQT